jgi:hypothetical protein
VSGRPSWTIGAAHALEVSPGTRLDFEITGPVAGRVGARSHDNLAQQARDAVQAPILQAAREALAGLAEADDLAEAGERLRDATAQLEGLREREASLRVVRADPAL